MESAWEQERSEPSRPNGSGESSLSERLAQAQSDLKDVIDALGLLGVKRCSQCRRFFSSSDPGALFGNGGLVCYECLPRWWSAQSPQLNVTDREKLETKLSAWLRKYHGAEVVKEEVGKALQPNPQEFRIAVHCTECSGSGKLLEGGRCRFCRGLGTVWIIAPM